MKNRFFALLALVLLPILTGCPSGPVDGDLRTDAALHTRGDGSDTDLVLDAARTDVLTIPADAAPQEHRLGSFNPTCTGTGLPHVVSGVQTAACATIANADVTAAAAIAASKIAGAGSTGDVQVNQSGVLGSVANVQATSNAIVLGANPAQSGAVRVPNASGVMSRNTGNSADVMIAYVDTSNNLYIGGDNVGATQAGVAVMNPANAFYVKVAGSFNLIVDGTNINEYLPIVGAGSNPWSVHGKIANATTGTFTLGSGSYNLDAIQLTGGTAGTVTFPAPGTDAKAYYKTVINTSGVTKTLSDGGASTPTLATALSGHYLFDTAGVHLTGPSVAYP